MSVEIFGKRNAYKIADPAGTLEKIAKKLKESEDPPEYNTEQMEKILKEIAKEFGICKMNAYLPDDLHLKKK